MACVSCRRLYRKPCSVAVSFWSFRVSTRLRIRLARHLVSFREAYCILSEGETAMVHGSGPYGEVISKDGVHWWEGELSRSLALYRGIVISSSWIGNPVLLIGGVHMLSPSYFHYLHQLTSGCLDSVGGALTSIFRISPLTLMLKVGPRRRCLRCPYGRSRWYVRPSHGSAGRVACYLLGSFDPF